MVPTKALITQFKLDFLKEFKRENVNDVSIFTTTAQLKNETENIFDDKNLLILTQERLQYFLFFDPNLEFDLDVLVIDEAQKIGNDSRGVILESTLLETIARNPSLQVVCSAPLAENPEMLNKVLRQNEAEILKQISPPVPQFIFDVDIYYNRLELKLLHDGHEISIDTDKKYNNRATGVYNKIAKIATTLGKEQMNIVFANGPAAARKIAKEICSITDVQKDEEVQEFMEFLSDEIHPLYNLIDYLKYGVAFHYSGMPSIVKERVEELYKEQKIKYLCCTSTLLEGVNLPAKNIFIYKPQEGRGNSMSVQSFWNLAGRAGRLSQELVGNIFCIETKKWREELYNKEKDYKIKSATEEVISKELEDFTSYLNDFELADFDEIKTYEQTASHFIRKKITETSNPLEKFVNKREISGLDMGDIKQADNLINDISEGLTIPKEILERNSSIDPRKQQKLLNTFEEIYRENSDDINDVTPKSPKNRFFYTRLENAFLIIDRILAQAEHDQYKYYTVIANKWISEKTLKEIIKEQVAYNAKKMKSHKKTKNKNFVNKIIYQLFSDLNKKITFHYAHFMQCYVDILNYFLKKKDIDIKINSSLPLYLEYGVHEKTSINVVSQGTSRGLSIKLTSLFQQRTNLDPEDFFEWISKNKDLVLDILPFSMHEEFVELIIEDDQLHFA